jgi:hypothetical protein
VIEVAMPTRNILSLYHHQTKNTMNTTTVTISSGISPPLIGATSCPRSICIALEYNLVADILKSLEAIPLRITHKHIKSHQDNEERTNILKLSWEAQLNITMTDLTLLHISTVHCVCHHQQAATVSQVR